MNLFRRGIGFVTEDLVFVLDVHIREISKYYSSTPLCIRALFAFLMLCDLIDCLFVVSAISSRIVNCFEFELIMSINELMI